MVSTVINEMILIELINIDLNSNPLTIFKFWLVKS